jgi:alpha-tubulin suppressor-like RCC1 family protein
VTFVRLATGTCTSYGLTSSGSVYSWGCGGDGEIGNGGWDAQPRPVKLTAKGHFISSTAENVVVG